MADYLEYDSKFEDIQKQDLPSEGHIFIYKDIVDEKIGRWVVVKFGGRTLGLFWDIKMARIFAEAL